jgi:hypothetical protein
MKQRANIKFCVKLGKSGADTFEMLRHAYGNEAIISATPKGVITSLKPQPKIPLNTGRFIMFSVIANIYNKKTKGITLIELFTATGKLKKFFDN